MKTKSKNALLRSGSAMHALALAGVGLIGLSGQAFAQEAQAATAEDEQVIVVTGSRIASPALSASVPVQIVDATAIAQAGAPNLQDVLLRNPAFGTPSISRTNSSFANSSAGVATVDLRNLGIDRTLVLIDGRRVVSGIPGSAAVDLNTIPAAFIERVDVLSGGASAVYGSDAVAGVVNIILKNNFEGVEIGGQYGLSQYGDDAEKQLNLTAGTSTGDGRGNIMVHLGYTKQEGVFKRNRYTQAGREDQDSTSTGGSITGVIDDLFKPYTLYSGYTPSGRYFTDNGVFTYNADGDLVAGGGAGYNRSAMRYLALPVERYLMAMKGNYEISDSATVFVEGTYASSRAKTNIEPFPFDTSYLSESGQIPIETNYNGGIVRNPYVPDAIFNDASDTDGDGLRDIFVTKRLADLGNRTSDARRDTFRLVAGLKGNIADGWNYESYYIYGQTKESQIGGGQVNVLNFRSALNAAVDSADINGNGNVAEIICVDGTARSQGCVPANIFGPGSLASAANYLQAPTSLETLTTQSVAGANITGELFSIGSASPAMINVGVEYRREYASSTPDVLTQQGLNANNKIPPTEGRFNVKEAFAELLLPIFENKPFFDSLSLKGAVRVSKYSTVGTTYSYNYGGEWAPVPDIRFRVTRAQTVRAPNISELYAPVSQDFPSNLSDPCAGITAASTGGLADRCRAAPGVNANIAANGAFAVSQADLQGITSYAGGNPNLREEKGKSFVAGVVIQPKSIDALRNLAITVDYFNIDIRGAIVPTPLQFILNQCYAEGNTNFCDFITRRAAAQGNNNAGSLDEVNGGSTNSGGLRTSGIDTTITYSHGLSDLGALNFRLSYTHLLKGYVIPLPGEGKDYFASEIGASKDRFTGTIGFAGKAVDFNLTGTFISSAYLDDQIVLTLLDTDGTTPITDRHDKRAKVGAEFYLDGQVRFRAGENYELYIGGNNLLNNKAPYLADIGSSTGQATDAGTYDGLGRRFYAGAKLKF